MQPRLQSTLSPITVIEEDSCYQNNILETWLRLLRILDVLSKCSVRNFVGPARFVSRAPDKSIVSLSGAFDLLCVAPLLVLLPLLGRETQRIRDSNVFVMDRVNLAFRRRKSRMRTCEGLMCAND